MRPCELTSECGTATLYVFPLFLLRMLTLAPSAPVPISAKVLISQLLRNCLNSPLKLRTEIVLKHCRPSFLDGSIALHCDMQSPARAATCSVSKALTHLERSGQLCEAAFVRSIPCHWSGIVLVPSPCDGQQRNKFVTVWVGFSEPSSCGPSSIQSLMHQVALNRMI